MTERSERIAPALRWFAEEGWTPRSFQIEAWNEALDGRDGLVVSPTGSGKTNAVAVGPILERLLECGPSDDDADPDPIRVLWITPLRALAADTTRALTRAVGALGVHGDGAVGVGEAFVVVDAVDDLVVAVVAIEAMM